MRQRKGEWIRLDGAEKPGEYSSGDMLVRETVEWDATLSVVRLTRRWTNISGRNLDLQMATQISPKFPVDHYLIPCVTYNGNPFGSGKEPKGLEYHGKPWIYAYDRVGIPSCSLVENSTAMVALCASDENRESLISSCSIEECGGRFLQSIYYPVIESPLTYSCTDYYTEEFEEFITLSPGSSLTTVVFCIVGRPRWKNYGMATVLDLVPMLYPCSTKAVMSPSEVWKLGISEAKNLLWPWDETHLVIIGRSIEEKGLVFDRKHFEIGWCGQNAIYARMFLHEYFHTKDNEFLRNGLGILDAWTRSMQISSGLFYVHYEKGMEKDGLLADTCNLGFGIAEVVRAYVLLRKHGIAREEYLDFARRAGDFFVRNYSDEFGFGKLWDGKGECVDRKGTIGAYMIPALMELYRATEDEIYLAMAKKALDFYHSRDLAQFVCTSGALDTDCVDKETSSPLLKGALMIYEETHEKEYLEVAQKAAYYFLSYMFHYNPIYGEESDFVRHGYNMVGATSVSVQHHHIDNWGGLIVPDLLKLARYMGNSLWKRRALHIWHNVQQGIARRGVKIHGMERPEGSQNEGNYNCRWGMRDRIPRGEFNDWLVAWPSAFRLQSLIEIEDWADLE
ncbi:MAG: hypothetical protein AB7C91_12335 [Sphaerochaeta sp.]|uniref:hypothetical protein n=1 Tax=Sphaerochaeta sp. TaxID=1972642 RepID=UPI003D100292